MQYNNFNFKNISDVDYNIVDKKALNRVIEVTNKALKSIEINADTMKLLYQRLDNKNSILAIKVIPGKDSEANFIFYECKIKGSCSVVLHNDYNGEIATKLAGKLSREVIWFFEKIEKDLNNNDISFTYSIPLSEEKVIVEEEVIEEPIVTDEKKKVKKLVKNFFRK